MVKLEDDGGEYVLWRHVYSSRLLTVCEQTRELVLISGMAWHKVVLVRDSSLALGPERRWSLPFGVST